MPTFVIGLDLIPYIFITYCKIKIFTLLSFVIFTLTVSAQHKMEPSDSFVSFAKGRYSLSYPETWSIDTSKAFGMDILIRSPKTDSLDDFMENFNVFVQDFKGQDYNLAKMGKESETQIKNIVTDVEMIESRFDTSMPQHYILKYKGRQGKYFLTTIQHYYLKDEIGYALTLTVKNGQEAIYVPLGEKMFSSFKIIK